MKNSSGKVLTIFVVISGILLLSLTALSIFFFQKEMEKRKQLEADLSKSRLSLGNMESEVKEIKKQNFLLQEKIKEADEQINSLMDDIELAQALREEMKTENVSLKEELEKETKNREQLQKTLAESKQYEQKIIELSKKVESQAKDNDELIKRNQNLEQKMIQLKRDVGMMVNPDPLGGPDMSMDNVDLDKIVVSPDKTPGGRVLSVDMDADFVIINLGTKDGLQLGHLFSVYRGKEYLGDIRVTRVQAEMSAADLIPPFSSRKVRKNDQIIPKT